MRQRTPVLRANLRRASFDRSTSRRGLQAAGADQVGYPAHPRMKSCRASCVAPRYAQDRSTGVAPLPTRSDWLNCAARMRCARTSGRGSSMASGGLLGSKSAGTEDHKQRLRANLIDRFVYRTPWTSASARLLTSSGALAPRGQKCSAAHSLYLLARCERTDSRFASAWHRLDLYDAVQRKASHRTGISLQGLRSLRFRGGGAHRQRAGATKGCT
jgi:hypothetical protein